ncbi:MAG: TolC family protein [Prevotella sp.]|nr:TolC family protein [Prevotella sp.]
MKLLLVILVSFCRIAVHAQQPDCIRLTQAVCHELSVKNSEDIQKQQNALQQALLDKQIAFAHHLPDIDASLISVLMKDTKITEGMDLQMAGTYIAGLSLTLPLYAGGKITTGNKLAKVGIEVQKINQEKTRQEVIYEADKAYFTYLAVKSKVTVLEAYMQQMDSLVSQVNLSVGVEMATNSDLLRIQAKRSEVEYNLIKAKNGMELCRMALCAALGLDLSMQFDTDEKDIRIPDKLQTAETTDINVRPEYQLLVQNIKAKELEIRNARAGMLPTLALVAQYSRYGWAYMKGEQQGYSYKTEISGTSPVLMASLSVPLWHWGKEIKKVKKAKFDLENAQLDMKKNRRLLSIENEQARQNLQDSYRMIASARLGLNQAEDNLHNLRLRYENSMSTLTDLLDAYSQWQQARSNHIEAQTQYKIYETEYLRITGRLL